MNVVGASTKAQKITMFYWTLANTYPEFRSTSNSVQLYAIAKSEHLKKPGALEKILEPFIKDIELLETDGIDINYKGELKNLKGSLIFAAGDTPASAVLGGFKESVAAYRLCRTCMTTSDQWKNNFHEENFHLRNKCEHDDHVEAVSDPTITKTASKYWKRLYGVNKKSPLASIIDVTICLPHDIMHIF